MSSQITTSFARLFNDTEGDRSESTFEDEDTDVERPEEYGESGLARYGLLNYVVEVVELTKLNIEEVYNTPICATLYYVCYILDRNKEKERRFREEQAKIRNRR